MMAAKATRLLRTDVLPEIRARIEGEDFDGPSLRRMRALKASIQDTLKVGVKSLTGSLYDDLDDLADLEATWQIAQVRKVTPVFGAMWVKPSSQTLKAIVSQTRFEKATLPEWMSSYSVSAANRIQKQINIGLLVGDHPRTIARRIFVRGGSMDQSLRGLDATVRTAANAVSTGAREVTYAENDAFIEDVEVIATLDASTTTICMGYDGKRFPVNKGPRPPFHMRCRTTTIPVPRLPEGLGLKEIPEGERASITGPVKASTGYGPWLKSQSRDFQNEALGPKRAGLFRKGAVKIDQFAPNGKPLNLKQLRRKYDLTSADFEESLSALKRGESKATATKSAVYKSVREDIKVYRKLKPGDKVPAGLETRIVEAAKAVGLDAKSVRDVETFLRTPAKKGAAVKATKVTKTITKKALGDTDPAGIAAVAHVIDPDAKFSHIRRGLMPAAEKIGADAYFAHDDREIGLHIDIYDALADPTTSRNLRIDAHQVLSHELGHARSPWKPKAGKGSRFVNFDDYYEEGYVELRSREKTTKIFKLDAVDGTSRSKRFRAYNDNVQMLERTRNLTSDKELDHIFSLKSGEERNRALSVIARKDIAKRLKAVGIDSKTIKQALDTLGDDAWTHLKFGSLEGIHPRVSKATALRLATLDKPLLQAADPLLLKHRPTLKSWVNDGARSAMNRQRSGGVLTSAESKKLSAVNSMLNAAPVYDGPVYRGFDLHEDDAKKLMRNLRPGAVVDQVTNASASRNIDVASVFASPQWNTKGFVFEVRAKAARDISKAVDNSHKAKYGWQDEVVLREKTRYRVVSVKNRTVKNKGWDFERAYRPDDIEVTYIVLEEIS